MCKLSAKLRQCKRALKVGLHKGDYRSKLVPFEAQKNILYIQKGPSLERFTPECKHHLISYCFCHC